MFYDNKYKYIETGLFNDGIEIHHMVCENENVPKIPGFRDLGISKNMHNRYTLFGHLAHTELNVVESCITRGDEANEIGDVSDENQIVQIKDLVNTDVKQIYVHKFYEHDEQNSERNETHMKMQMLHVFLILAI